MTVRLKMSAIRTEEQTCQALSEATDPTSAPWRLATLADDPDPEVRMAVAANPSASSLTVMRLRCDVDPRVRVVVSARYGIGA
jgi:hypothetical protein